MLAPVALCALCSCAYPRTVRRRWLASISQGAVCSCLLYVACVAVLDTPGHTRGHITLYFPEAGAVFPGAARRNMRDGHMPEASPMPGVP